MTMDSLESKMRGSSADRPSDRILESINRLYEAKLSGAVTKKEFSLIITQIGDLCANKVKQGKMPQDSIDSIQTLMDSFTGENATKYFNLYHEGLSSAARGFNEGIDMALFEREQRLHMSEPVKKFRM